MRIAVCISIVLCVAGGLEAERPAGSYYRMKKAAIVDEHGFERPMRALSLLIPAD